MGRERIYLFNGNDMSNWVHRDGTPAKWKVEDGVMTVVPGTGCVYTKETYGDAHLHVEFNCPYIEGATGQGRSNSGVYIHGCYEVQVLDSWGNGIADNECGAVYSIAAPIVNASARPGEWQTYDIIIRAAVLEDGKVVKNAFLTLIHNGQVIHNNLELPRNTPGGLYDHVVGEGPLWLQDHGNYVHFRNIWVEKL